MAEGLQKLFEGRQPVASYGGGAFRLAGAVHASSLLILPDATYSWPDASLDNLVPHLDGLAPDTARLGDFFLLGTGEAQFFPGATLCEAFEARGIGLEVMSTGAACRTFNLLLAEQRVFSAALIAV